MRIERKEWLLVVALGVTVGCVKTSDFDAYKSQHDADYTAFKQKLQAWTGPNDPTAVSPYANLRAWQLRVTDVVCKLEELDQAHRNKVGANMLCPTPGGPGNEGAPPPPPPF